MVNKVGKSSNAALKTSTPGTHRTASGNLFNARVKEGFDPRARGINLAAPRPGAVYKMYTVTVKYEDQAGLFKGADQINVNANSKEMRRNFGRGEKDDRNLQQATGSALRRTGPNTFEGEVTVVLEGLPGKSREDVSSIGFTFAQLKDNSFAGAKFDGAAFQEYRVPMKLVGPAAKA